VCKTPQIHLGGHRLKYGAEDRTRTGTLLTAVDFELLGEHLSWVNLMPSGTANPYFEWVFGYIGLQLFLNCLT